ncbi:putative hydrolase [Trichoderma sp. SZMC 28015]
MQSTQCLPINLAEPSHSSRPLLVFTTRFPRPRDDLEHFSRPRIREFAKKYTVVTPTLRGYPPSDVPPDKEDYAAATYVGKGSAVIVGHDFGGVVKQKFTSAYSDMLKGLVMVNTPITPPKNISTIMQHILNETYRDQVADYVHKSPLYGMLDFYNENFPVPPYGQNLKLDSYLSPAMLNGLQAWFDYGIRQVVVPGAGHWPFRDRPTRFNAELRSFLKFLEY